MKVLLLTTVREFYRQRAGFFLVLLGVLFGFLSGREHHAFAVFFLTAPQGALYLLVLWGLYAALLAQWVDRQWSLPAWAVVYQARLLPPMRKYRYLSAVVLGLLQPVLYHALYLLVVAGQEGLWGRFGPIGAVLLLLAGLLLAAANYRLQTPGRVQQRKGSTLRLPVRRPARWTFWTLEWLLRERGLTLLLSKAGAMLVMMGTLTYYQSGTYDLRLPAIGSLLAYLLNVGLSYELYGWESQQWLWARSLPVAYAKHYRRVVLLHALLLLPETLLALRYLGGELTAVAVLHLYGLGLGAVLLYHSSLYRKHRLAADTLRPVFWGYLLLTFAVLYHLPIAGLALVAGFIALGSWWRWRVLS
jgi:hypothetical protein